jgi:hypothetical protein
MSDDIISLTTFGGEVPVKPPHLLPQWAAQQALFCDFTHGHLMPLKQGLLLTTMSAAVKTIYTEDGVSFYTWPTEVSVAKSPVLNDTYSRVYFIGSSQLRATTVDGMSPTGGQPSVSWLVGVPQPTVAPTLAIVERTTLRDYPGATVSINSWWEYDSERYQEVDQSVTTVNPFREFSFSMPALNTTITPSAAVARATLEFKDTAGSVFLSITLSSGDTDMRTDSLPGNVTASMTASGLVQTIKLIYGVSETRAYTYTCKNTWLEEGPPGPASTIDTTYMQDVAVTFEAIDFATAGYRPLLQYNTYRTIGANPSYLRVHEGTELSFTDTSSKGADVLGSLDTLDYMLPPAALDVFIVLSTGVMMGFHDNMLYMSDPYRPHTWQYQLSFRKSVRSICEGSGSVVLTTAEGCYAVLGAAPATMKPVRLPTPQAGIAQRSISELDERTVFASNDGIVTVSGTQAGMSASQNLFARDDWQARYGASLADASMRFGFHDGRLVAVSDQRASGFVIALDEEAAGQYTQFNEQYDAMFRLPAADCLYYARGADIYQFRAGAPYSYTWWSREFTFASQRNLGAGYIRCSGPVTLTLYIEGALWCSATVSTGYFRPPSGRTGLRWSVKLEGTATVEELVLARTPGELKRV